MQRQLKGEDDALAADKVGKAGTTVVNRPRAAWFTFSDGVDPLSVTLLFKSRSFGDLRTSTQLNSALGSKLHPLVF